MKRTLTFSILAVLAVVCAADPAYAQTSVAAPVVAVKQANPNPPSILTFQPGSSWAFDVVGIPVAHQKPAFSGCVSTVFGSLPLGGHWAIVSDVLGGIKFADNGLTIGWGLDAQYSSGFKIGPTQFYGFFKGGFAEMYSATAPAFGFELAAGFSIPVR